MDDILLTDYKAIIDEATSAWMAGKGEGLNLEDFTSRAVCRAQVQKVVEWAESHVLVNVVACQEHPVPVYVHDPDYCRISVADWAALKAVGGG